MSNNQGWDIGRKQRKQYLEAMEMLHGSVSIDGNNIDAPRASVAVYRKDDVPRRTKSPCVKTQLKEWQEQAECYKWTQTLQILRGFVMCLGNEQKRDVIRQSIAKKMGLLSGASDLFIARPIGIYHGLWLEMKQNRHYSLSERRKETWLRQEDFQKRMRSVGFAAYFAFGAYHGIRIIQSYLNSDDSIMENLCNTSPVSPKMNPPDRVTRSVKKVHPAHP